MQCMLLYIEDITWPRGDTKFLFECWKIFHQWAQRMSEIFFQHEKRTFVSPSGHVMFYLSYKHQWNTKPFYLSSFFGLKGAVYYEAIATVIFSHVIKITCYFHMWRYQVYSRKLTWYFIGVYIIKCNLLCDTVYHKFFYCYVNKEHASQFQLSSETLVTTSWKGDLMAVAQTAYK